MAVATTVLDTILMAVFTSVYRMWCFSPLLIPAKWMHIRISAPGSNKAYQIHEAPVKNVESGELFS
jgi:hypothetical protein